MIRFTNWLDHCQNPRTCRRFWNLFYWVDSGFPESARKAMDEWGSFFLLNVTEYLKLELKREHYADANELLSASRIAAGQVAKSPTKHGPGKTSKERRKKWTAAKRIENLKKSHSPNWIYAVAPILIQLRLNRIGEHRYCASPRHFLDRWMSQRPLSKTFLRELERRGL